MPVRKKKHPRLPNGFGSIKWLGKGRNNPYGVYPPTEEFSLNGSPVTRPALAYVDDWMKGFTILLAYKNGTYYQGMEADLPPLDTVAGSNMNDIVAKIISDYAQVKAGMTKKEVPVCMTFSEVYEQYFKDKYEDNPNKTYSNQALTSTRAAYKHCVALYDTPFDELRFDDLQAVVDNCKRKHSTKELIVSLIKQMYRYAIKKEIVDRNYSEFVTVNAEEDDEHGEPFTWEEVQLFKELADTDEEAELLLIMCLSGYRINAYRTIAVDFNGRYFYGGNKTAAGRNNSVPIHSIIMPYVRRRMKKYNCLLPCSYPKAVENLNLFLNKYNIEKHTYHDTKHTFSSLCSKFHVDEIYKKKMMGHKFADVTNRVYGHWDIEDLRVEIEKIKL